MKSHWRFAILLVAILAGGTVANFWSYLGEARVERKPLKEFPKQLGSWNQSGRDQVIDSATMSVLRASDYVLRDYSNGKGGSANFYVGYYASQREGVSFHSPLNCLPGTGWVMTRPEQIAIAPVDGGPAFQANRYLIENGASKSVLVYWYQGRGRRVASEYLGKIYTVLDSVRMRRSDAALVRVTVSVGNSEANSLAMAADFAAHASVSLSQFVPD